MMLASNAPAKDFTTNPLRVNLHAGSREWRWSGRYGRAGMGRAGMGMTTADAIAAIAAGAGPGTPAYESYYGAGGTYSQAASVMTAAAEESYYDEGLPSGPPAPMLYAAMPCGAQEMSSGPCVGFNAQVQAANLVLQENARRAWNLATCERDVRLNPGTATNLDCGKYRGSLPIPAVPPAAQLQQAVCTEGECYTPYVGQTSSTPSGGPATPVAPPTPQQQASSVSGKPNQTVPPKGQPGEVPKDGGGGGGETVVPDGGGKIFGMDPIMLAVVAGVALLALRK